MFSNITSSLKSACEFYSNPNFLCFFALGINSGIPFLLTLSTLSIWLSESGLSVTHIGLFTGVSLPYALKFLWGPLIDQTNPPKFLQKLGREKTWGLISQLGLIFSLITLAFLNPKTHLLYIAVVSISAALFSSIQDTVVDSLRIQILSKNKLIGGGAASSAAGFRLGMMISGAGAVYLSMFIGWSGAYLTMALCCTIGGLGLYALPTLHYSTTPQTLSLIKPWLELIKIPGFIYLISFIFFIKIANTVMNSMSAPFLLEIGFSKLEYTSISKVFGVSLTILGNLIGGLMVHRTSATHTLLIAALCQGLACLLFAGQSIIGYNFNYLIIVLTLESFSSGLLATGFISYLSEFCTKSYCATHFTLLYAIGSLTRIIISMSAGWVADYYSWFWLFLGSSITVIPAIYILFYISRLNLKSRQILDS